MTDRVTLQLAEGELEPGQYSRWGKQTLIRCPECGEVHRLDHSVADSGDIHPSVVCPDCGWHVWARLEGWGS